MSVYNTPTEVCPYCAKDMEADWVDNGVGMVQCGPYHCYDCGASEIGPEYSEWLYKDREGNTIYLQGKRIYLSWAKNGKGAKQHVRKNPVLRYDAPFTKREIETGFYEPESNKVSPYANTVNGRLVDHITAKKMYNIGLLDEKISKIMK